MVEIGDLIGSGFGGSGTGAQIAGILPYILGGAIIAGAFWFIIKYLRYNIKVNIYNPYGSGKSSLKETDKALILRDRKMPGVRKFKLLKYKDDWLGGMIDTGYLIPVKKLFNMMGYEVNMVRDGEGRLQPIRPVGRADVVDWQTLSSADIAWAMNEIEQAVKTYQNMSAWERLAPVVVPIVGFAIVGVLGLVMFKEMSAVAEAFKSAASTLAAASQSAPQVVP